MEEIPQQSSCDHLDSGNVYIMTHSFFSDVIKIGCTPKNPTDYAKELSSKTPGTYALAFSIECKNPCQVKKQLRKYLDAKEYVNEFYQVPPDVAAKLLKQETLKIPNLVTL